MPYQIEQEGSDFKVINLTTKKTEGTYPNRAEAMKKMKALYKAPAKEADGDPDTAAEDKAEGKKD